MYTREQASLLRKKFFTALGQYMLPVPSADGSKVNWLNYKTGVKEVFIRIGTPNRGVEIGIVVAHPNEPDRSIFFGKLLDCRLVFEDSAGRDWIWQSHATDEYGKKMSRIFVRLDDVSALNQQDWPVVISFLKSRLVALDEFWYRVKDQFESR